MNAQGLARIAHPVCIVAAAHEGERSCATATTMYASLVPPTVLVSHRGQSTTARLLQASGEFSVSLLADSQLELADRAGRSVEGPDKLAAMAIPTVEPRAGRVAPGVRGSLAVLWCRVLDPPRPVGDQVVFAGEVVGELLGEEDGPALLRHERRYRAAGEYLGPPSPEGYPL